VPNKIPPLLKDAVLEAASQLGFDGMGKDGLVGYLQRLPCITPRASFPSSGGSCGCRAALASTCRKKKSLIARSSSFRPLSRRGGPADLPLERTSATGIIV
jgi:hypothetical protein